jgi:hypothetical protein
MTLHVLFTKDGVPAWIGQEPRAGSEAVEELTVDFLAAHRRTSRGAWVLRPVPVIVAPSAEDIAAQRAAAYQAALAARDQALREELAVEADPLFFLWQRGEAAKADWLAAVDAVKARYPKPALP